MERLTAILASVPSRTTSHKSGDSAQESRLGTGEKVLPPVAAHCPMHDPPCHWSTRLNAQTLHILRRP